MTEKLRASLKDPVGWLFLAAYITLFILSFLTISAVHHRELTSDQAVQVLMANDFSWQYDLYYWGQTRLGSFLPALSSVFVKLIPAHPLVIVSIVQYVLVAFGFFLLSSGITNRFLRLGLATMWLLPFPFFAWNIYIGQPYTSQYFFLGCALLFLKLSENVRYADGKRNFLIAAALLSWMLSAWINDIMLVLFPIFLLYISLPVFTTEKNEDSFILKTSFPRHFSLHYILFALGGLVIGIFFLLYAKAQASWFRDQNPLMSDLPAIFDALTFLIKTIYKAATFQVRNVLISFHTLLLMLALLLAFFPRKNAFTPGEFSFRNNGVFFLLLSLISLLIVLSSRWVEINLYDTRYFCLPYYLFLIALGFRITELSSKTRKYILIVCVCLAAALSSITSLMYHRGTQAGDHEFSFIEQKVLAGRLGNCAVIGNYKHSYSISAGDPDRIVATPHEKDHVRNSRCVEAMLLKEKVFLVGNGWLEIFPDTISQFGRVLVRADKPFLAQHLKICEYR